MPVPLRLRRLASFLVASLAAGTGVLALAAVPAHAVEAGSTAALNGAIAANEPAIELTADFTLTADITDINYPVTIEGNDHTVSAAGFDAFDFSAQATISDLTVTGAANHAFYVAIPNNAHTTLTNVSSNDTAQAAVYAVIDSAAGNGSLTLTGGRHTDAAYGVLFDELFGKSGTVAVTGTEFEDIGEVAIASWPVGSAIQNATSLLVDSVKIDDTQKGIFFSGFGNEPYASIIDTEVSAGADYSLATGIHLLPNGGTEADLDGVLVDGFATTHSDGSGVYVQSVGNDARLTIADSTFVGSRNNVLIANGGTNSEITIQRSTLSDAAEFGLWLNSFRGNGLVDATTVDGNGHEGIVVAYSSATPGSFEVRNSTVSGNGGDGVVRAAVDVVGNEGEDQQFRMAHSTVTANQSPIAGLRVQELDPATVSHSIVSGNDGSPTELAFSSMPSPAISWSAIGSVSGDDFTPGAGFLFTDDPGLLPLADNGGPTATHMPLATSPVLDAGNPAITGEPATDQRGEMRIQGAVIDIGAVEFPAAPVDLAADTTVSAASTTQVYGKAANLDLTVSPSATGEVSVKAGSKTVTGNLATGKATVTIPAKTLEPGTHSLDLSYRGVEGAFKPSAGIANLTVTKAAAVVGTKGPKKVKRGKAARFKIAVSVSGVKPSGKVTVKVAKSKKTAKLNPRGKTVVKLKIPKSTKPGKKAVTVTFHGDAYVAKQKVKAPKVKISR